MEKTAINAVYVITVETKYKNGSKIYSVNRCFYREDEAKKFVVKQQNISNETKPPYIIYEYWEYIETKIE